MKLLKFTAILPLLILLFACNSDNKLLTNKTKASKLFQRETKNNDSVFSQLFYGINVFDIKKSFCTTSEVLSIYEAKYFNEPDSTSFYGRYYLINRDTLYKIPFVAELVIYTNGKPWRCNNKSEKLIDLIVYTPHIKFNNGLNVGITKYKLFEMLGRPSESRNNVLFYVTKENLVMSFKIKGDTVNGMRLMEFGKNVNIYDLMKEIENHFDLRCL